MWQFKFNPYAIPPLATAFILLAIGISVWQKSHLKKAKITFTLFCLSMIIWLLGFSAMYLSPNEELALQRARAGFLGITFIPILAYHFILSFINSKRKLLLKLLYISSIPQLVLSQTDYVYDGIATYFWGYYPTAGNFYFAFMGIFFSIFLWGVILLFKELTNAKRNREPIRTQQIKYVLLAFACGTTGVIDYLIKYKISVYPYGYISALGFIAFIGYAIAKYRLMDITLVLRGGLVFLSYLAIVTPPFISMLFLLRNLFGFIVATSFITIAIGPFIYQFIRYRSLSIIDSLIFKDKYKYIDILEKHIEKMALITGEEELFKTTASILEKNMSIEKAAVFIRDYITGDYHVKHNINMDINSEFKLSMDSEITDWLKNHKVAFVLEEEEKRLPTNEIQNLKKELEPFGAKVCIPARLDSDLLGIIALGNKTTGEMYTHIDLDLLERLGIQLAVALDYKRIEAQLRKEQELASIGIMSMEIGHELRNLLQLPQTYIDLSLEKRNDNDFYRDFRNMAMDRMKVIRDKLNDIMYLGKERPLDLAADVEINTLLDENLMANDFSIKKENIEIVKEYSKVPLISADKSQLTHLFNNLILNAIDAMKNIGGKLRIRTAVNSNNVTKEMKDKANEWLRIEVKDDGTGIPEHVMKRLFTPFVTTKSLGRIEKSGTGLGLSVIKKVVDAHKGYIHVHTKEGKGTTFVVDLPIELKASYVPVPPKSFGEPWEYKE